MLVLTRKPGEALHLTGGIVIRVAEVAKGAVRLAIDAPDEVKVWREELANAAVPQK